MAGEIAGRSGSIALGASSTTTSEIGKVANWQANPVMERIDVTNFDSNGWQEGILGRRHWTLTVGTIFISSEADQGVLRTQFSSGTRRWFSMYASTSKTTRIQGYGWLTNYTWGAGGENEVVMHDFTIESDGSWTFST